MGNENNRHEYWHRRVPNLEIFFKRKGQKLAITTNPSDYKTGEIVSWMINGKLLHIGIITSKNQLTEKKFDRTQHWGGQVLSVFSITKLLDTFKYSKKK
jgi:uncharacterized protein YijF (DUF1287 family)